MQMDGSFRTAGIAVSGFAWAACAVTASAQTAGNRIPMRLELDVNAPSVVVGENFPVTVRVANPNPFQVDLPRFAFGYDNPELEVSLDGGKSFISGSPPN